MNVHFQLIWRTAIIAALITISHALHAQQLKAPLEQAGYYRIQVGDYEVTALSDGTVPIHLHELLTNVSDKEIDSLSALSFQTATAEASVNAYLIRTGGKLVLIDAGTAELYGPTLGHLPESLQKIGVSPEQIDAILITHIHTDHTGGLMLGDKMMFPNATIYISRPETDFWLSETSRKHAPERLQKWFKEAADKVGPYMAAGKVKNFEYGQELLPGITPLATPGHTPGHTFYSLESKGERMLFVGDIIHAAAVQLPSPSVTITFDVDPGAAAAQRIKAFKDAAAKGYWVAADHVSFPGVGHLRAQGNGFIWIPVNYSTLGNGQ
ncbi:MBL fold metallo-hydrolase [Chitinophaga agri]|uniref:MBL fold metallo-hydrolase n=1 Tax=Chitinophaga agri TaxID=2703787 RepID=A0A6B9ZBJ3_9BACT|nr:MBL fold metallo-hydrolase [Chitinophaga agri]QHS59668.1 MBL fold metallo-hydrolase [Chitinophaga agri]